MRASRPPCAAALVLFAALACAAAARAGPARSSGGGSLPTLDPLTADPVEAADALLGLDERPAFEPADDPVPGPTSETAAPPAAKPYWRHNFFKRLWTDQGLLLTQWWPSEFARPGFSVPLGIATAVALTSSYGPNGTFDVRMADWSQEHCTGSCRDVANTLTTLGDTSTAAVGLGVAYLVARGVHNERLEQATSLSAEALINTGIYNEVLKFIFGRTRPPGDSQGTSFHYGSAPEGQELGSLPGGHSQGAFTVASVFAKVYSDHKWVGWVFYSTAGLIAAGRVGLHRHFPSDVVVGGILGESMGRFVVERSQGKIAPRSKAAALLELQPVACEPGGGICGLGWSHAW